MVITCSCWQSTLSQQYRVNYVEKCALSSSMSRYQYDQKKNTYVKVDDDVATDEGTNSRRKLLRASFLFSPSISSISTQRRPKGIKVDDGVFVGRECPCGSRQREATIVCPAMYNENYCQVPTDKVYPVECVNTSRYREFIVSVWPLSILWLTALLFYLISTESGRLTIKYICSKVCCCWEDGFGNSRLVETIISRETAMRDLYQIASLTRAVEQQQHETNNPVTYVLKTKAYNSKKLGPKKYENESKHIEMTNLENDLQQSPSNETAITSPDSFSPTPSFEYDIEGQDSFQCSPCNSPTSATHDNHYIEDDDDEVLCTICMVDIEDGDRVGALPCDHLFHAECLKEWIRRRNVCPLCQDPIAEERSNPSENSPSVTVRYPATFTVRTTGSPIESGRQRRRNRRRLGIMQAERSDDTGRQLFYVNSNRNIPPRVTSNAGVTVVNIGGNNRQLRVLVGDAAGPPMRSSLSDPRRQRGLPRR